MKRSPPLFALLALAYVLYAGAFIYRTSARVERTSYIPETRRYFVLFDDAMISMRYARNLAHGEGLVWNPGGPRVEGFTNPLWVGYMALVHAAGLPENLTSLAIQITGALCILATLWVVLRIGDELSGDRWVGLGAAAFTAFYLPLNTWSLQGTEVSVLTLILTLAAWSALRALRLERFPWAAYALLALSTAVRLDMAVPFGALAVFMACAQPRQRMRHLLIAPLLLAACLAPQFGLRRWYYGEWLPNTYPLKMEGYPAVRRVTHGLEIATRFTVRIGLLPLGIFLFRRDRGVRLVAWLVAAQMLYSVWVGGDAWEHYGGANRYVSLAMPLLFVLLWLTLRAFYRWLRATARPGGPDPRAVRWGFAALAVFLFATTNYTYGTGAWQEWLLLKPSLYAGENGMKVREALLLKALTTPDATVALAGAGIVPYFADRPYVDLLGKNDPVIAHLPMDTTHIPEFKPGHMKWDYAYSIGVLQPDVVLELWVAPEEAGPYLDADYVPVWFPPKEGNVWMRRESPKVYWDRM